MPFMSSDCACSATGASKGRRKLFWKAPIHWDLCIFMSDRERLRIRRVLTNGKLPVFIRKVDILEPTSCSSHRYMCSGSEPHSVCGWQLLHCRLSVVCAVLFTSHVLSR